MKFRSFFSYLFTFLTLATIQTTGQTINLKVFKGDNFTLEYPADWQTSNEDGILNFYPKSNYGALTLSYHSGVDFPLEKTRAFILEMNEIKDKPSNVKMITQGKVTQFYHEYTDKGVKWVTKAFRKNTDFYLLTINCDLTKWASSRTQFMNTINSFKIN